MGIAVLDRIRTRLPIGLDIGAAGLRVVQLRAARGGIEIGQSAVWERGSSEAEDLEEAATVERIARFVRQVDFNSNEVITALSTPVIELHPMDVPLPSDPGDSEEVLRATKWEVHRLTNLDKDQLQTAAWRLPSSKRARATLMGVAANLDDVSSCTRICSRAGLECIKVDVSSCALAALAWRLRDKPANQVWGILDLGAQHSRLAICVEDSPVLVRTFDIGGEDWTQRIAAALRLSLRAAERHKRDLGLVGAGAKNAANAESSVNNDNASAPDRARGPDAEGSGQEFAAMIMGLLRDDLQRLALEAERSYEYILQCYPKYDAGDLVLAGGGALLGGLDDYLAEKLGIKVLPIGRCPSAETEILGRGLGGPLKLEVSALACALSLQGIAENA